MKKVENMNNIFIITYSPQTCKEYFYFLFGIFIRINGSKIIRILNIYIYSAYFKSISVVFIFLTDGAAMSFCLTINRQTRKYLQNHHFPTPHSIIIPIVNLCTYS